MLSAQTYVTNLILATVLLPGLSIPFLYILPKKVNRGWIVSGIGLLQIGLSIYIFIAVYQGTTFHEAWPWLALPNNLSVEIGIYVDLLSALLLAMVSLISWLVGLYSMAYLPVYTNFKRYFSLYSLSLTAMLWILVADNLWGIFIGWEMLSIASCLLICFWYQSYDSIQASTYSWVISKLGSICFLIGILLVVIELGNCNLTTLYSLQLYTADQLFNKLSIAGYCLVIASLTKSAQFPFFSWLPQAMVAPTSVSALLHTATVLSAGVYLLIRIQPILNFELNSLLVIIGNITALMGAAAALTQQHLKRMLAYSTLSHLGYVVAAIGLGNAYIGISYLVIHAFSKACLFLMAGFIATFLQSKGVTKKDSYTMAYMGGMLHKLPWVAISYLIAAWGLGIIPGLIGFSAKESILAQTFMWASHGPNGYLGYLIPLFSLVSNGLSILYMGKTFVRIFLGKPRWKVTAPTLPSLPTNQGTWIMQGSMMVCAGSVLWISYVWSHWMMSTGVSLLPSWHAPIDAWPSITSPGYEKIYDITQLITYGLLLLVILWLVISRLKSTTWIAQTCPGESLKQVRALAPFKVIHLLFLHGWYLDSCTSFLARQVLACSKLAIQVEKWFFDGLVKGIAVGYIGAAHIIHWIDHELIARIGSGIANLCQQGSKLYLHLQSGQIQLYIIWSCIGMGVLIVMWIVLG